ncbi:MAG: histidine phosphatase family protein, partial [Acidobacteriota bacterium]
MFAPRFRALLLALVAALGGLASPVPEASAHGSRKSAEAPPERPAALFVVRHAEKMRDEDPRLTPEGHRRSAELARVLGDAGLDAIYATQWRRTRATAAPLAVATGLDPQIVETTGDYAENLAKKLLEDHTGEAVLVVGHSHTTPGLLAALGVEDVPEIPETQYDDLFLVVFSGGAPRLISLDYGAPTPSPPSPRD